MKTKLVPDYSFDGNALSFPCPYCGVDTNYIFDVVDTDSRQYLTVYESCEHCDKEIKISLNGDFYWEPTGVMALEFDGEES